ncbi:hypothetical protein TeGR_g15203 [Tetraparma gracilis]|uniref:START domain-containing protein n=1 Tax=Tetraparma gracilis TaxID=2962635 RepID=A0ABQ6MCX1_9STRA|nr:hypothetical protein TeGR_g15203 [Tetraparma gracilis]
MSLLPKLFDLFDRSSEVDEAIRVELANFFQTTSTVASEEENELIDEVVGYEEQDWKRIPGTVQEPVEYFQVLAKTRVLNGIGKSKSSADAKSSGEVEGAWGKATANIDVSADRCLANFWHSMDYESNAEFEKNNGRLLKMGVEIVDAPIAEVAAWELAKMSRESMKGHVAFGGLDRNLKKINDHQDIFHVVYNLSIPTFLPRQFVSRIVWKWAADKKELTVVYDDVKHTEFPARKEYLRASVTSTCKYKQEADVGGIPQTKVTYTVQVDLGGAIPKWVQNQQGVGSLMYLSAMRKRFDQSPAVEAASNLRLVTMIQNHDEPYTDAEDELLRKGVGRFRMFEKQKAKELKMDSASTKAKIAFEKGDGHAWGYAKATVRARPTQVLASVLDFMKRSDVKADHAAKAMKVVNGHNREMYVWFRPMMDTIAQRLLESVGWGLKMRLYTGAGLNMELALTRGYELIFESIPGTVLQLGA